MKFTAAFLASAAAADLTMLGDTAGWTQTGNTFKGAGAWTGRSLFLGKKTNGGMCASGNAHLETNIHLSESRYGELGSVMMRADATTKSTGYKCTLDTRKGQGILLTRDGKKPNNCIHRDFSNGAPTRWDPSAAWRAANNNQCFIRDRAYTMYNGATDYKLKMTIVENADNTATIQCSVAGKLMAWYTDPCPLTGGDYGLATSRNVADFGISSFTDSSCDAVKKIAEKPVVMTDGLTLSGIGKTAKFWKSVGSDTVSHYYSGACNSAGGKNREAGAGVYGQSASYGARSDALNVAALKPAKCVKNGFIEADVTLVADYLNGAVGQYGAGSQGNVGILMRVDSSSDGKGHKMGVNYDSWGYMFQVSMDSGKFAVYRGNNGGDHNKNSIAAGYLTGRYRCKTCKCTGSWDTCTQFQKPVVGAAHTLRMEISQTASGFNHIKAYLNGTMVADKIDQPNRWGSWIGTAPSAQTNMCGDFGLATYDSDVVKYKIKDYTGYVAPTAAPTAKPTAAPTAKPTAAPTLAVPVTHKQGALGICAGTDKEFTVSFLNKNYPTVPRDLTKGSKWYTHPGLATGICNVRDVKACENVCRSVEGCNYFSMSHTQACYACFIHKTCDAPSTKIGPKYKTYELLATPKAPAGSSFSGNGICHGTHSEFTTAFLNAKYPNVPKTLTKGTGWYTHNGLASGICNVRDVAACEKVCDAVEGCNYFSISLTQDCYACFIHKTCTKSRTEIGARYHNYKFLHPTQNLEVKLAVNMDRAQFNAAAQAALKAKIAAQLGVPAGNVELRIVEARRRLLEASGSFRVIAIVKVPAVIFKAALVKVEAPAFAAATGTKVTEVVQNVVPTAAPTPAPTAVPGVCATTRCTYTMASGKAHTIVFQKTPKGEKYHCEKSASGCTCMCSDSNKCTLRHHTVSGYKKSMDHC
jgi:hypothetical protein